MTDPSSKQNYQGLPVPVEEPTAAEWARLSREMGFNLEAAQSVFDELANMLKFRGMDPAQIIQRLYELGTAGQRPNWLKDVTYMIAMHICRGTKISKIKKSVSDETKNFIEQLERIYQLKETRPQGDDITLARIALSFPLLTLRLLPKFEEQLTVKHHHMTAISPNYPMALMHPAFASLVTAVPGRAQDTHDMLDAHRLYLVELTKVINPEMKLKTVREIAESFEQPLQAGFTSTFTDADTRRQSLTKLEVVDDRGRPVQAVVAAANKYRQLLG